MSPPRECKARGNCVVCPHPQSCLAHWGRRLPITLMDRMIKHRRHQKIVKETQEARESRDEKEWPAVDMGVTKSGYEER